MFKPGHIQILWCFGGGGGNNYPPPAPPPATNTPAQPGSDAFQRFQEIRSGLLTGQTQLIDNPPADKLGSTTKGSQVAGP